MGTLWICGSLCGLFLWILALQIQGTSGQYSVHAPRTYIAFTEDIVATFRLPAGASFPHGRVELISLPSRLVLASAPVPPGFREGTLTFGCGVIDFAGDFLFHMLEKSGGDILAESAVMTVTWPSFSLTLPETHTALVNDVEFQFQVNEAKCASAHKGTKFWFDVVYFGQNDSDAWSVPEPQLVTKLDVVDFISSHNVPVTFSCQLFDQAGIYRVLFRTNMDNAAIARSRPMRSEWSASYSLETAAQSVFPCAGVVVVRYTQPECSGNSDKVRLYRQERVAETSAASPTHLEYVAEKRAKTSSNGVTFSCDLFHRSVLGYCFIYVSSSVSGAVHEQRKLCIPTSDLQVTVVDGGWSAWSGWSSCEPVTGSCGLGQQSHFRACDNPKPSPGGKFCSGDTVEWRECYVPCKGDPTTTTPPPVPTVSMSPACRCGCPLVEPRGSIVTSSCLGSTIWTIHVEPGHIITLKFLRFTIDPADRSTWVKVRDGESQMSELLVWSPGGGIPAPVTSTQNILLVEFMAPYESAASASGSFHARPVEGFVATYTSQRDNSSMVFGGLGGGEESTGVWERIVTIGGIVLCAIIVIATLIFVCYNRWRQQQKRHKRAASTTGPGGGEALLINGELPNSPSHSGNSVEGSKNQSFGSPAGSPMKNGATPIGSPTKREYVMARGVNTPGHDGVDISIDKQKGYAAAAAAGPLSRRSSHSSVTVAPPAAVHSPYMVNAGAGDYKHNPQLFNVSPVPSESPRRQRKHKQRHRSGSPSKRVGSPHGSVSPTRDEGGRKGGIARGGAPIANCDEDLSPISPVHSSRSPMAQSPMGAITEHIPMDTYPPRHPGGGTRGAPRTDIRSPPGTRRPPVEGRDSLTRRGAGHQATTPDRQNANYLPPAGQRPDVKPLPLRDIQRPDGQSPENKPHDPNANTPSSMNSLSPILQQSKLFPQRSPSMDITLDGEMEYDDYIPDLPGSYFTMDPHAYTLTWSQQQPWASPAPGTKAGHGTGTGTGTVATGPSTRASSQGSLHNNGQQQLQPHHHSATSNC